jgi:hypothetical protein
VTKRANWPLKSRPTIPIARGNRLRTKLLGDGRTTARITSYGGCCDFPIAAGSGQVVPKRATQTVNSNNYQPLRLRGSIAKPVKRCARLRAAVSNSVFRLRPKFEEERMYELDGKN